ncbi:MAG: hypothetical protein JRI55_41175 [Deltaproteobacteria bacterium]|nr:hypothetical protein [Deltaproteobacteria bacterium]
MTSIPFVRVVVFLAAAVCSGCIFASKDKSTSVMIRASEGGTVTASDGDLQLEIPAGALSRDTRITVRLAARATWPDAVAAREPVGDVYEFLPDGLTLSKPATLTSKLSASVVKSIRRDGKYPALAGFSFSAGGKVQPLASAEVGYNLETNEGTFTAEISHFSWKGKERKLFDGRVELDIKPGPRRSGVKVVHKLPGVVENLTTKEIAVDEPYHSSEHPVLDRGTYLGGVIGPDSEKWFADDVEWLCTEVGNGVLVKRMHILSHMNNFPEPPCEPDADPHRYEDLDLEMKWACVPSQYTTKPANPWVRLMTLRVFHSKECVATPQDAGIEPDATEPTDIGSTDMEPTDSGVGSDADAGVADAGVTDSGSCSTGGGTSVGSAIGVGSSLLFDAAAVCSAVTATGVSVMLHSSPEVPSKPVANDHTTIKNYVALTRAYSQPEVDGLFGTSPAFPCGASAAGYAICPSAAGALPAGDLLVLSSIMAQPVPLADAANYYQFGFVFDSDGNPTNNFQADPNYPNDFFKDTDLWYVASYAPSGGWTLTVTDAKGGTPTATTSNARIIINDNAIFLVAPASELAIAKPSFRLTAFRHGGDSGFAPPHDWDGSLSTSVADPLTSYP